MCNNTEQWEEQSTTLRRECAVTFSADFMTDVIHFTVTSEVSIWPMRFLKFLRQPACLIAEVENLKFKNPRRCHANGRYCLRATVHENPAFQNILYGKSCASTQ
jgi:hypothetical protein